MWPSASPLRPLLSLRTMVPKGRSGTPTSALALSCFSGPIHTPPCQALGDVLLTVPCPAQPPVPRAPHRQPPLLSTANTGQGSAGSWMPRGIQKPPWRRGNIARHVSIPHVPTVVWAEAAMAKGYFLAPEVSGTTVPEGHPMEGSRVPTGYRERWGTEPVGTLGCTHPAAWSQECDHIHAR